MSLEELVRPGRTPDFDTRHGQLVTAVAAGTLFMSGQKLLPTRARSTLLYLPGVLRLDVRALADTLQVMVRPLHPDTDLWDAQNTAASRWGGKHAEADLPWHGSWICMLATRPLGVIAKLDVYSVKGADSAARNHITAHGVVKLTGRDLSQVVRAGLADKPSQIGWPPQTDSLENPSGP